MSASRASFIAVVVHPSVAVAVRHVDVVGVPFDITSPMVTWHLALSALVVVSDECCWPGVDGVRWTDDDGTILSKKIFKKGINNSIKNVPAHDKNISHRRLLLLPPYVATLPMLDGRWLKGVTVGDVAPHLRRCVVVMGVAGLVVGVD